MDIPEGWTREADALTKSFRFADFGQAFAFLTRVADHAKPSTTTPNSHRAGIRSTFA